MTTRVTIPMAIWQFKALLLPTRWADANAAGIIHYLGEDGWELEVAWRESATCTSPESIIDQFMPRSNSCDVDLTTWGDDEHDDIQLLREDGEIVLLQIRIDARRDHAAMLQHTVSIARQLDCSLLLMEEATVIEPLVEELASRMADSTAARYAEDPVGTLTNWSPAKPPRFRPN